MSGSTVVTLVRERETKNTVVFVQVADPDNLEVRMTDKGPRLTPAPNAILPSLYLPKSIINGESAITVNISPQD